MLFIYLDETFNLKKGTKNQFLAIAGYSTNNPRELTKMFARIKRSKLPKRFSNSEVKSSNVLADKFIKPYLFPNLTTSDISIYCNLQYKNTLQTEYFIKDKLNYDLLYLDLLKDLLVQRWKYMDEKIIIFTLDTFKTKKVDKSKIIRSLITELNIKYPDKKFEIVFEDSAGTLNLQLADLICSVFNDHISGRTQWLKLLKDKIIKTNINPIHQTKRNEAP